MKAITNTSDPTAEARQILENLGPSQPLTDKDIATFMRLLQTEKEKDDADHRILVQFGSLRSREAPLEFGVTVWEVGKRLSGHGDASMVCCRPRARLPKGVAGKRGCGRYIPSDCIGNRVICPHCQQWWRPTELGDGTFYRLTLTKASEVLADIWRRLEGNADFLLLFYPTDIRIALMAQDPDIGLEKAKKLRGALVYRLPRLLRDTQAGKSLEQVLQGFLLA